MPIEFRHDREKEFLLVVVTGHFTLEGFEAAMKDTTESDQFPPDIRPMWDMRELDFSGYDRSFEERLIHIQKKFPQRGRARVAWIVADDHAFGMGRMYEALSEKLTQNIKVFRSYAEAEDWLLQA